VTQNNTQSRRAQRSAPPIPPDPQARATREELILRYLPLVERTMRKLDVPKRIDLQDLHSIGVIAAIETIDKLRPTSRVSLAARIVRRSRDAMLSAIYGYYRESAYMTEIRSRANVGD
jgi:DNA-directed RNA polymerase specialized sigma subunit